MVNDFGHHGQVLDLHTGSVTATLHGGDYRPDTVPFSLAFTEHAGRTVVVHRTEWNRLDITEAATGRLLTGRTLDAGKPGHPPEHYLDYFHGALYVSPDGRYVADDGWVWHPVGMPTVWDLRRWLDGSVWESEEGPSRQRLCLRAYHWNSPMCWHPRLRLHRRQTRHRPTHRVAQRDPRPTLDADPACPRLTQSANPIGQRLLINPASNRHGDLNAYARPPQTPQ